MAEVKIEQADESQGIKLFGKTIVFKVKVEEPTKIVNSDEESLEKRRPDEIKACPRCKSMDTKFCYFNNYNVNQPRHFCKGCQRYWTAGGALRNVPVGAGRRKAKPGPARPFPLPDSSQSIDSLFDAGVHCLVDETVFQEYWTHHQRRQQQQLLLATGTPGFDPDFPAVKRRRNIGPTGQTNC